MFDHISIGVRDLARTKRFYDAVLRPLGCTCLSEDAGALGYGRDKVALWIGKAGRPVPPDPDSNLHFCFAATTRAAVDDFHAAALSAGGADNGAPGLRPDYGANYYAAFAVENHRARRELRRCASLDPRFARDIGITSDELAMVCAAPPWKAVTRPPR